MNKLILQNILSFVCFPVLQSTVATGHIQLWVVIFNLQVVTGGLRAVETVAFDLLNF